MGIIAGSCKITLDEQTRQVSWSSCLACKQPCTFSQWNMKTILTKSFQQITLIFPSKHIQADRYRLTSETPFQTCFAGGSIVFCDYMLAWFLGFISII